MVPGDGSVRKSTLTAANAAGMVEYTVPKTVSVDNDLHGRGVVPATPNDPDTSAWVNHAVTVDAMPSAGPSGVGGMTCSVDRAAAKSYVAGGLAIDGDGVHTVSCTAWNNAVDPQGQPNTGTSSMTVHIDESPPSLSFQPQNPGDPTALVVDTSDTESGVAGGSIEMAPAGTSDWTPLPASFDGSHLVAHFDDAGLSGPYSFRATSCDNVGNCASTTRQLSLPLREASDSQVSLTRIVNPLQRRVVREQVRVGWHWATVRRHGKLVRVKRGGRLKTINAVKYVEQCTTKRVRTGPHRWRVEHLCQPPKVRVVGTLHVPYGHSVTIHGLYTTAAGVPLGGRPGQLFAAPNNGSAAFGQVAAFATGPDGSWTGDDTAGTVAHHSRSHRRQRDDPTLDRTGDHDRAGRGQVAARAASPDRVGRHRASDRSAAGRIPAAGRGAGAAAHRVRPNVQHVRRRGARERRRPLLNRRVVRTRRPERVPNLLVPDRLASDEQLPLRPGCQLTSERHCRRPPAAIAVGLREAPPEDSPDEYEALTRKSRRAGAVYRVSLS